MTEEQWLGKDNQLGIDIWNKKYRYNNETFDEWLDRVSGGDKDLRALILEKKFLFGGRILSNRGLDKQGEKVTLSNCYVIEPPEDNIESIFDCAKKLARTYSYGGGCGVDISKLAPKGAKVTNTAKETSGSVSFMDLYSLVTGLIGQNGRRGALMISIACDHPDLEEFIEIKSDLDKVTKANISIRITDKFMLAVKMRGALMISIACDHPDLEEFIEIKSDLDKVTKANISIRITDKFMLAVKMRKPFVLSFTREETGETIRKEIDAYSVFHKLCEMNWDYAEPGMLFWDRIENWNLLSTDKEFSYAGTNPCAEEPLPAGGSCLLGSINLSEFVTENRTFNFTDFKKTVDIAVKALNIVLGEGLPLHPLKEQRESVRNWRQIGLGIFGLADLLIKMGIKYGSPESIDLCDMIGHAMAYQAIMTSNSIAIEVGIFGLADLLIKMGIKYGSPESIDLCDMIGHAMAYQAIMTSNSIAIEVGSYPKYKPDAVKQSPFFTEHIDELYRENISEIGLCNSQLLTIAPTGSLSSMLGVSGGIEPVYANYYTRKTESLHGISEIGLCNSQLLTIAPTGSLSSMLGVSGGIEPVYANYYTRKTESLHGHDEYYKVYTPIVKKYIDEHGLKDDSELPDFFVTAQTLNYKERIDMQSIWQRHIDASISSTVNVPNSFTVKDTEDLLLMHLLVLQ